MCGPIGCRAAFIGCVPINCVASAKQMAAVTMEHIREAVVETGLATDEGIDDVIEEMNAFSDDSRTVLSLPRIFQVWGKRPT